MRRLLTLAGSLCLVGLLAGSAWARVEQKTGYTKNQAFQTALRYLRVERGYTVTEKDVESGYLLFEYPTSSSEDTTNGSVEVIERSDGVTLVVQLPQLPEHHERHLVEGLLAKLRSDYGAPPERKPPSSNSRKKDEPKKDDKDEEADEERKEKEAPSESSKERVRGYRIQ